MSIKTIVRLDPSTDMSIVATELNRLEDLGHTVASNMIQTEKGIIRTWNTMEAAQGWLNFVKNLTPPPSVAEVQAD